MTRNQKITLGVIIVGIVLWAAYDIYPALTAEKGDTISEMIRHAAFNNPIIGVAFGILIGHWFWCPKCDKNSL